MLTDTVPYPIYQFNRETGLWVSDNPGTNKDIILTCSKDVKDSAELVSISGKVKNRTVEEVLDKEFDVISFEIDEPGLKRVLYKEDVVNIQAKIKDDIEKLL